jgi:trans-aconitate 2-methyltransferase
MSAPRYTFRDTDLARARLELVADVFAGPSTSFLREQLDFRPQLALDLGCGPGRTTRLVAEVTGAACVVGLDMSEPFLRSAGASRLLCACVDVTGGFPTRAPDLVYARFVLAHLPKPEDVVAGWAGQLRPGGLLLLDEVDWIRTDNPVLDLYEQIVSAMVASRGAQINVGPRIVGLSGEGWRRRSNTFRRYDVTTADAARMYSMNLATWRRDPFVLANHDSSAIDDLASGLDELTHSSSEGEITWGLRQVAYERL